MRELFCGRPLKVVEQIKKEIIYQIKMIKLDSEEFDTNEVENIQNNIDMYLEVINGIYQDLIIEYLDENSKIGVYENPMGEILYDKVGDDKDE